MEGSIKGVSARPMAQRKPSIKSYVRLATEQREGKDEPNGRTRGGGGARTTENEGKRKRRGGKPYSEGPVKLDGMSRSACAHDVSLVPLKEKRQPGANEPNRSAEIDVNWNSGDIEDRRLVAEGKKTTVHGKALNNSVTGSRINGG